MDNLIYSYTNEDAIRDGIKIQIGPNLFITNGLADVFLSPVRGLPLSHFQKLTILGNTAQKNILDRYNAGDFGDGDKDFAVYVVAGTKVWAIRDGDGLHLILPEEY